jgi:hypothetical protein
MCTRTRGCSDDIKNFAASHLWATVIDWETFRGGWEAGAQWASRTPPCSCMLSNKKSELASMPHPCPSLDSQMSLDRQ